MEPFAMIGGTVVEKTTGGQQVDTESGEMFVLGARDHAVGARVFYKCVLTAAPDGRLSLALLEDLTMVS